MLAVALLTGCIDPEKGRSYDEFLADYRARGFDAGPVDPVDMEQDAPPAVERCSVNGGAAVTVEFVNDTSADADLYWVDPECERFRYASLAVGATHEQSTFVGHVWRLYVGNAVLGELVVDSPDPMVLRFE